jgi:hypothetical protein
MKISRGCGFQQVYHDSSAICLGDIVTRYIDNDDTGLDLADGLSMVVRVQPSPYLSATKVAVAVPARRLHYGQPGGGA